VNGEAITLADLRESFATRHVGHGGLLVGKEILRAVLDRTIAERLLIQEGRRMGIPDEPGFKEAVEVYRDLLRLEALEERFIRAPADPSAEEASKAYDLLPRQLHLAILETRDRSEAEEALGRLRGGEDFDAVARRASVHPSRTRGGDLGWITWGILDPETEEVALRTAPGLIAGPFPAGGGFRVLKVIEEQRGDPPPFDGVADNIRAILRARRQERLRAALLSSIRKSHPPAEDAAALARLFFSRRNPQAAPDPPDGAVLMRTATDLTLTAARVRARAKERGLALDEAWRAAAEDALLIDEARRRIASDASIERRLRLFADARVRDELERTVVLRTLSLDEGEVRAFYEKDPDAFGSRASYHLRHIVLHTRADAEEARRALASGADFSALARERSLDAATASAGGDLGWLEAPLGTTDGKSADGIFALGAGETSEVIATPKGFSVVQVLGIRPGETPPFGKVRHEVAERLLVSRQRALRDAFVARLRERGAVRIFEEAVTRAVRLQDDSARGRLGHVPSPAPAAQ
jgi:parvulin-like peptidyl-prolyl isomerase